MPYRREQTVQLHPEFGEYVAGRNIAVVGPAAPFADQSRQIEDHDLVVRVSLQFGPHPAEYGSRTDIAYLNSQHSRDALRDPAPWAGYRWVVCKQLRGTAPDNFRPAHLPSGPSPNQITMALHDLAHYGPASVTVFGADFYLAGPAAAYYDGYRRDGNVRNAYAAQRAHDQQHQRAVIRRIQDEHGWPVGDTRFLTALELDDAEYYRAHRSAWTNPAAQLAWTAA